MATLTTNKMPGVRGCAASTTGSPIPPSRGYRSPHSSHRVRKHAKPVQLKGGTFGRPNFLNHHRAEIKGTEGHLPNFSWLSCGLGRPKALSWRRSTWHKGAAAFLLSAVNLWCQLVLAGLHRSPGNIKKPSGRIPLEQR
ncbi:hypothetical protein MHYP_G00281980 [Metynnis hypsauchen]